MSNSRNNRNSSKINSEVNKSNTDEGIRRHAISDLTPAERDYIVREAFHHAWGLAGQAPSYDKAAWCEVQKWVDPVYRPSTLAHPDHAHLTASKK